MAVESYRFNTAWRKAVEWYRHDGTAWRKAKERWRHDGTAWRKVFSGFTVASDSNFESISTDAAAPFIRFNTDGTVTITNSGGGFWGTPQTAGVGVSYWISYDGGAWVQIATDKQFNGESANPGSVKTSTHSYRISSSSSGAPIVGDGTIEFISDRA